MTGVQAALIALQSELFVSTVTPSFFPISENRRSSTTLCLPRPVSIIIAATTLSWAQRVENTTECAHWLSLTQVCVSQDRDQVGVYRWFLRPPVSSSTEQASVQG